MNLVYSILWFDDESEYFDSLDLEPLEKRVQDWGFDLRIDPTTDPEKFRELAPYDKYDLLVVDYNLSNFDKHGDEFIEEIRNHGIYTEIIFYSANPISDLWDAVAMRRLEGVFLSPRGDPLMAKIENVARQSVKKVLDLNNVRGMVMAEVAEIDGQLDSLAVTVFNTLSQEGKQIILEDYIRKISKFHDKKKQKAEGINGIDDLLDLCESSKKWQLCRSLIKKKDEGKLKEMDGYQEDILMPRNFLAHGTPVSERDTMIFNYEGKEYRFNDEEGVRLRKDLKMFSEAFKQLCDHFSQS